MMNLDCIQTELPLQIKNYKPLSGGDINKAYYIESEEGRYFIKINRAELYPQMFSRESDGLQAMGKVRSVSVPEVAGVGEINGIQYLLLEWIEKGTATDKFWKNLGSSLAQMHQVPQQYFGFEEDNYIGSLPQQNTKSSSWEEFYGNYHIFPLVRLLRDQGRFRTEEVKAAERFCRRIKEIFPEEPASLVHGDLWSGNYLASDKGKAILIDPAVYYGHREMDLGMTLLFGGFSPLFYEVYQENYPLEKNWRQRVLYTQIYPLLAHAVLFGEYYVTEAKNILKNF